MTDGGVMSGSLEEFWRRYMRPRPRSGGEGSGEGAAAIGEPDSLDRFLLVLLEEVIPEGRRSGLRVGIHPILEQVSDHSSGELPKERCTGVMFVIEGKMPLVDDAGGGKAGSTTVADKFAMTQSYQLVSGELSIHLTSVTARGRGGLFVQKCLLEQAQRYGVRFITLRASQIGSTADGLYAWARYGFIPDQQSWDHICRLGTQLLADAGRTGQVTEALEELRNVFLDAAPAALRRAVYLSWTDATGSVRKYLNLALSAQAGWNGALDTHDPAAMEWARVYIRQGRFRDPNAFLRLLPAAWDSNRELTTGTTTTTTTTTGHTQPEEGSESDLDVTAAQYVELIEHGDEHNGGTREERLQEFLDEEGVGPRLRKRVLDLLQERKKGS